MTKIKMIVSDLDGTLLKSDKSISEKTKNVLNECKKIGYKNCVCYWKRWKC